MNSVKIMGEFFMSQLQGRPIYDLSGRKVGKLVDMAVCWEAGYPQVKGLKYAHKVHQLIPVDWVCRIEDKGIWLDVAFDAAGTVPLQDDDVYISKWLLDKQIIDLAGSRIVRVNDVTLSWVTRDERRMILLLAVDIGVRGLFRRLGLEFLFRSRKNQLLGWQHIKPLESFTSNLQLVQEKQHLSQMHPADIADLMEEMSYKQRASFMGELDSQQVVDALAEMDLETQVEIIEQLDGQQASDILEEMSPDDAADILSELPEEKSQELLELMEAEDAEEVRELMSYKDGTAGALMTTEYIALAPDMTVDQTINKLRELAPEAETIYYLYVVDEREQLLGVLSLRELIIASPEKMLKELMHRKVIRVNVAEDEEDVAEVFQKYGLLAVPVVDETDSMLGIVTVDDILYQLMPEKSEGYASFAFSKKVLRGRS